ncbi:unnamed protein product [Miscanthus lutarioriparius]|uniref:Uncharacterized protein n=1 Tax=Miscanthus lutarioriparius TaxID=422564 RepID=A0A811R763_9POAL|nr:unnamed protein product [Miscanthus lutarioriparius]
MEEEGFLEVRCAGCGDTLEVERGLTEFACPSCATPQALPPELMPPPPPRPRRALPLGLSAGPARVPCAGCGAVLAVPRGTRRLLACPLCGAEIDIDGRERFAAYSGVQIISPPGTVVLAATSSRLPEEETISRAVHVGQVQVGSHNIHRGESPVRLVNETVEGGDFRKKSRPSTVPRSVCVDNVTVELEHSREEAHGENGSGSIRRFGIQKATYAISGIAEQDTVEPPIQTACAEPVEVQSCGNTTGWNLKRRKSSETTAKNQNGKKGDLSSSREHLSHSKLVQPQGKRDRDPIQQIASSPDENQFDPSDIDRIITRLCPSALPEKQVSQASSDDLNIDATLPPISTNHCIFQSDCFPDRQHQAMATGSLANQGFCSVQAHEMPQECLNGIVPSDKSSKQKQNPPADILHRQYVQEYPSHDSQSEEAQVGFNNHNKYSGHYKNTAKGSRNLSTEGDYFAEQHHTSTNQRVDATTSTPLPTATPLPVATPTSVVSRPPVQRSPPQYKSLEAHHSQGAQSVGIGSINRPPKKRGGRGPTKLIEPRREAYRPVLTPNNIDGTWDVEPPCSKVAYTISTLLKQWHPGSTYVPANQLANEVHHEELILHWHQYHSDTRAIILDEFLQRYKWGPGQEAECLKLFERKVVRQFNSILCDEKRRARVKLVASRKSKEALDAARSKKTNLAGKELKQQHRNPASAGSEDDDPLQWKPFPPEWMQPKWWEMLCEHWVSEEVLQVSAQKRKNRYTGGSAQHTAGSRSIAMHRKLMIIENGGKPVSDIEVFNKTHKHNGGKGEFVTEKAKKTMERFKRHLEAGDTEVDLNLVWAQQAAGGRKRGRYYRLQGIIDKARIGAMAKSTPGCVDEVTKKEMFTQDQVQEMISQAAQQLNEAWEKRFQSLEQRMQGTMSSEAPQHNPLPRGAQPVAEDQASHQDASDSSHGGSYQSTADDDEDDEDYVVN